METYLKCLLRCVPRVELTDRHLKNILLLHKIHGKLGGLYSKLYLECFNLHKDDPQRYPLTFVYFKHRMLYFTVRSFIIKNKYWLAGLILAYLL